MRDGVLPGVESPFPLVDGLPGIYQEDDLTRRWTAALDEVLAPVFVTLDGLPGYLDPALTPEDFLEWLAGWVGVLLDENWPIERRRTFVAQAADLYRLRGTRAGLEAHVGIFSGGDVEIEDSGAVSWSTTSGSSVPGSPGYQLRVRVIGASRSVDRTRLEALVAEAKPAHTVHSVEVAGRAATG